MSRSDLLRCFSAIHRSPANLRANQGWGLIDETPGGCRRGGNPVRRISRPDADGLLRALRGPTGKTSNPANEPVSPANDTETRVDHEGQDGGADGAQAQVINPATEPVLPANHTGTHANHEGEEAEAMCTNHTPPSSREDLRALHFATSPIVKEHRRRGFRRDYQLGDALRSPSDAVFQTSDAGALRAVNALKKYDFAFVKRSDGSFSYATLAYRAVEHVHKGAKPSSMECMTFVIGATGATKKVARWHWADYVRLAAAEVAPPQHRPPVRTISCVPLLDEEYSMLSNVSDKLVRARIA